MGDNPSPGAPDAAPPRPRRWSGCLTLMMLSAVFVVVHWTKEASGRCEAFWCWRGATIVRAKEVVESRYTHQVNSSSDLVYCDRHQYDGLAYRVKWFFLAWAHLFTLWLVVGFFTRKTPGLPTGPRSPSENLAALRRANPKGKADDTHASPPG